MVVYAILGLASLIFLIIQGLMGNVTLFVGTEDMEIKWLATICLWTVCAVAIIVAWPVFIIYYLLDKG